MEIGRPNTQGAEEVDGIAAGGKLYVFGGLGLDWKAMEMVMEYDPRTDRWTRKRDIPHALHHVALAEVKERICMFGGFTLPQKGKLMWVPASQAGNMTHRPMRGERWHPFLSHAARPMQSM